jgi:hypothetical protein
LCIRRSLSYRHRFRRETYGLRPALFRQDALMLIIFAEAIRAVAASRLAAEAALQVIRLSEYQIWAVEVTIFVLLLDRRWRIYIGDLRLP